VIGLLNDGPVVSFQRCRVRSSSLLVKRLRTSVTACSAIA